MPEISEELRLMGSDEKDRSAVLIDSYSPNVEQFENKRIMEIMN